MEEGRPCNWKHGDVMGERWTLQLNVWDVIGEGWTLQLNIWGCNGGRVDTTIEHLKNLWNTRKGKKICGSNIYIANILCHYFYKIQKIFKTRWCTRYTVKLISKSWKHVILLSLKRVNHKDKQIKNFCYLNIPWTLSTISKMNLRSPLA